MLKLYDYDGFFCVLFQNSFRDFFQSMITAQNVKPKSSALKKDTKEEIHTAHNNKGSMLTVKTCHSEGLFGLMRSW